MIAQALLEILEPAYRPCVHFSGACEGACEWKPSKGLVPCAFGGATGSLDEVRLVIVTAEPGDPPDSAGYQGTPQDMVQNSLRIFHEAMKNGGIERVGRPTPFHRNMSRVLKAFWPNESLEVQLRKTWTTNAVLCPAKVSGAKHHSRVELACAQTYLARQLELFPNAFVLALGTKARDRMQASRLRFDAVAMHPSAIKSAAEKLGSWEAAALQFRGELSGVGNLSQVAAPLRRSPQRTTAASRSLYPATATDLHAAIHSLPPSVSDFFWRLMKHPDYYCEAGRMQLKIYFKGAKVGGLNRKAKHWYFSKVFVGSKRYHDAMTAHGFTHVVHNQKHNYWAIQGLGEQAAFEQAMVAMTGVRP